MLAGLDDAAFRALFAKSPVKRIGRDRFLRNVAYALGNSNAPEQALPAIERLLADRSPLVRGAAVWALSRLAPEEFRRQRSAVDESDSSVRREWMDVIIFAP
jgi:epoxyqueuosine reductase